MVLITQRVLFKNYQPGTSPVHVTLDGDRLGPPVIRVHIARGAGNPRELRVLLKSLQQAKVSNLGLKKQTVIVSKLPVAHQGPQKLLFFPLAKFWPLFHSRQLTVRYGLT